MGATMRAQGRRRGVNVVLKTLRRGIGECRRSDMPALLDTRRYSTLARAHVSTQMDHEASEGHFELAHCH